MTRLEAVRDGEDCPTVPHFHYRLEGRTVYLWSPHADEDDSNLTSLLPTLTQEPEA